MRVINKYMTHLQRNRENYVSVIAGAFDYALRKGWPLHIRDERSIDLIMLENELDRRFNYHFRSERRLRLVSHLYSKNETRDGFSHTSSRQSASPTKQDRERSDMKEKRNKERRPRSIGPIYLRSSRRSKESREKETAHRPPYSPHRSPRSSAWPWPRSSPLEPSRFRVRA
jgi:hypothetical protein